MLPDGWESVLRLLWFIIASFGVYGGNLGTYLVALLVTWICVSNGAFPLAQNKAQRHRTGRIAGYLFEERGGPSSTIIIIFNSTFEIRSQSNRFPHVILIHISFCLNLLMLPHLSPSPSLSHLSPHHYPLPVSSIILPIPSLTTSFFFSFFISQRGPF